MEANRQEITVFGFWLYLMTDCILFATLFAAHAVLSTPAKGLFHFPTVLVETFALLTSTFSCALAGIAALNNQKKRLLTYLGITFLLGALFLGLEISEFKHLIQSGNSYQKNASLSAFFTLVGTHGVHISFGMLWMLVLTVHIFRNGLNPITIKRLTCFRMFWHFLDVVWIFIFTFVYMMSAFYG